MVEIMYDSESIIKVGNTFIYCVIRVQLLTIDYPGFKDECIILN